MEDPLDEKWRRLVKENGRVPIPPQEEPAPEMKEMVDDGEPAW